MATNAPTFEEVYTADELARATGVPRAAVERAVETGLLRPVAGTFFFAGSDALRVARQLRNIAAAMAPTGAREVFEPSAAPRPSGSARRIPLAVSSCAHGVLLAGLIWLTAGASSTAAPAGGFEEPRLVFVVSPGPGGGGGGSGARNRLTAPQRSRRGPKRPLASTPPASERDRPASEKRPEERREEPVPAIPPEVTPREPEPLAAQPVIAPVVVMAAGEHDRAGAIHSPTAVPSRGPGAGGEAGAGEGAGIGGGTGRGIGDGSGGGTGGGPYRAGSGIQPPRLLREVKADYTEEARRRGLSGEVLLEIVVSRDGTVGDVTVVRGLGAGLDERAVAAVRQWRFAPAIRQGEAVDVLVEVAVEFMLR